MTHEVSLRNQYAHEGHPRDYILELKKDGVPCAAIRIDYEELTHLDHISMGDLNRVFKYVGPCIDHMQKGDEEKDRVLLDIPIPPDSTIEGVKIMGDSVEYKIRKKIR